MLPQFPEGAKSSWVGYNFVTCNDIRVALARPAGSNAPTHPLVVPEFGRSAKFGSQGSYRAYLVFICGFTSPVGVRCLLWVLAAAFKETPAPHCL